MYNVLNVNFFDEIKKVESNTIDLILTDPPYGISHSDGFIKQSKNSKAKTHSIMGDNPNDLDWDIILSEFYRVLKPNKMCYIFGRTDMFIRIGQNIINSKLKYCHDFIWRKGDMNYGNLGIMGNIHEMCIGLSKGNPEKSRPLLINGNEKKRYKAEYSGKVSSKEYYGHPTQKPIGLLSYIILGRTDIGDLIFDPFVGAGSTNIACEINGRNSLSFELDQTFYDLTLKRLNDEEHIKMCKKQIEGGLEYSECGLLSFNKFE
jgi:site-specific DNA-methyltransferase (adenine-specific)